MKTIQMSSDLFREKVFDYENEKKWKFIGKRPAIIDFYADWCGPCKMLSPVLEEIAADFDGKVDVYKIDTEQEQQLAGAFGIQSIPALLFIPMEGDANLKAGFMGKEQLTELINKELIK